MPMERRELMEGTPLDEKGRRMLQALLGLGPGWHDRTAIAAYIGKNRLNPVEIVALDTLAALGKVDREMRPLPDRPQVNQYVYRVKG